VEIAQRFPYFHSLLEFSVEVLWEVETIGNIEVNFRGKRDLLRKSRFFSRLKSV
jgi:hypothetical protein